MDSPTTIQESAPQPLLVECRLAPIRTSFMISSLKPWTGRMWRTMVIVILRWLELTVVCTAAQAAKGQIDNVTAEAMTMSFNQGMAAFEKLGWAKAIDNPGKAIVLAENYRDKVPCLLVFAL